MASTDDVDWDLVAWVKQGPTRVAIVKLLAAKPRTTSEIAKSLRRSWGWIRHALEPMRKRGIVTVLTSPAVRRYKLYGLTPLARRILEYL